MENPVEDQNVISPERWRAWEARGRAHGKAVARKIKLAAAAVLTLLVLAGALYLAVAR